MLDIKIARLRKNRVFIDNLRFDLTPAMLFKPRFANCGGQEELIKEIQGFSFYIDYMPDMPRPELMVMKTYNLTSKSIAHIEDAPEDLLRGAVKAGGANHVMGMYPVDETVADWIKKELETA
ncbi:MAG: hypothetical protein M0Z59_09895 [Nitrospiraceae bacterium]|nr:hypothetical protein [Nitrospiraceae bacterium]